MILYTILSWILLVAGGLFIFAGCVGVVRLPDALSRSHALTKAMTLGIILMLSGLGVGLHEEINGLKIILAILFQLITIPLAGHLFVMIVYRKLTRGVSESQDKSD